MSRIGALLSICLLCFMAVVTNANANDRYCEMANKGAGENSNSYLVVIDTSYQNTKSNKRILYEGLNSIFSGLEPFDRLTVKTMDTVGSDGSTVFDRCLPDCPDSSWLNKWGLGNCDTMQVKKDDLNFKKSLLTRSVTAVDNPTFQSIEPDLIRTLSKVSQRRSNYRSVILFSYMQHQDQDHRPKTGDDFDSLFFDLVIGKRIPSLEDRVITIFGISTNDPKNQINLVELRQFWQDFFSLAGADLVAFGTSYQ